MAGGPDRERLLAEARAAEQARRRAARDAGLGRSGGSPGEVASASSTAGSSLTPVPPARPGSRGAWLAVIAVLFAAVVAGLLMLRPVGAGAPAGGLPPGSFPLSIQTVPAEATVTLTSDATRQVAGTASGPVASFALPQGAYSARLEAPGYRPLVFKVILPGNASIRATLNPASP